MTFTKTCRPMRACSIAAFVLIDLCCMAQGRDSTRLVRAQMELGSWVATANRQPFWLQTNQYGIAPRSTPAATLQVGVWKEYAGADTLTKRRHWFGWGFGVNPVVNVGNRNQLLLPEAYAKVKFGGIELWTGRRRQLTGLGDSTLSSGFMSVSNNALPIPKVQLATRGYLPFGFLRNWVAVNAGYAHGWFNVPYIQRSYLHQKYLYWRFGKPTGRVRVHAGLNHQVQWGGRGDYLLGSPVAVNGKLPSGLKYYDEVVFAINPGEWSSDDYTSYDGAYRIGNHVGSADAAIDISTGWGNWFLYHQHIYEDQSGLLFLNSPDGLTGLSWARNATQPTRSACRLQRVVVEYVTTLDQTGPTFDLPNSRYQGGDNYYNHGQYREGWSYLGRSLGTPFVAPGSDLRPGSQGAWYFPNNRVQALYIGVTGLLLNRITWTTRLSYSRNQGTFSQPYASPLGQFSSLLTTQLPLQRWHGTQLTTSVALDQGQLRPNTFGVYIGLLKRW